MTWSGETVPALGPAAYESDPWYRDGVPKLPEGVLQWAAEQGKSSWAEALLDDDGGASASWVDGAYANVWNDLVLSYEARMDLSRAVRDGASKAQQALYRVVNQHYMDLSDEDVQGLMREGSLNGDPFSPNPYWKKRSADPEAPGTGVTSWYARAAYGRPIESDGGTFYSGDVPKEQVIGRFGDTPNELVVARNAGIVDRLLGRVGSDVAVKRSKVGNIDTDRLQRRAERLRSEIDDPDFVYPGARMGFRHRAAELTAIESELVKREVLAPEARRTSVVAALSPLVVELAGCQSAECAPPPVGTGGSSPGGVRTFFHVTPIRNLSSIKEQGLLPMVGERSSDLGETTPGTYLFPTAESLQGAEEWLLDTFGEDEELAVLAVRIPANHPLESDVEYEQRSLAAVPAKQINVLSTDFFGERPSDLAEKLQKAQTPPVPDSVAVKRNRVGNIDTDRLQRRAERLRSEIDDPDFVYPGARMGFRHRAAELTAIESELVKREVLAPEERRTSVVSALLPLVAACHSAECAPPPVGVGGSQPLRGGSRARQVVIDTISEIEEGSEEGLKFGRQMLLARQKVRGFHQLSSMNADLDPAMEAEHGALSKAVPVQEGFVRDGTEAAAELTARIAEVLPGAQVGWMDDVHAESVNALLDGVALYPEEVRAYVKGVALGYTEAESHVAAFGPHGGGLMGPDAPGATLWLGPKAVRPAVGEARPEGKAASVMATVGGFNRHRIVGAHEMAHAVHNMAAQRAWRDGRRVDLRTDALVPEAPTTPYGGLDTGERVAETFALAARDSFKGLLPSQQGLIVSVLERAGLRPEQLDFAVEEREPYEVQFFGDDFGLEPDALRAAGCQSADCAPPPVGTGGSKKSGMRGQPRPVSKIIPLKAESYYDGEIDKPLEAYGEMADNPKVIERLMEGVGSAPFVRPGEAIYDPISQTYARSGKPQKFVVASAGCQSADCAPPPVGTGGSKPGGGRVAEIDGEALDLASMVEDAYGEIWDDVPEVIERAYQLKMAMDHRMDAGVGQEEAYRSSLEEIDASDGDMPSMYSAFIDDSNWWTELRSVVSATVKSPSPDADMQVLIQRMHETTQEIFSREGVSSIEVARSFDNAYSIDGNEGAAALYGKRSGDDAAPRSGITSWSASTYSAQDWGTETDEQTFPVEQVLMREGSIDGEFLVGESVERVREIVGR